MADIKVEVHYDQPPEKIWRALTDPKILAQWLMPNDFRAELGAEFAFRAKPVGGWDGIARCKVIALDPPRELAYRWASNKIETVVRFTLVPEGGGTWLKFEQTGFAGFGGFMAKMFMGPGWRDKLKNKVPLLAAEA
jgi:uncharacterized protein YndB with AHSA1/START domain